MPKKKKATKAKKPKTAKEKKPEKETTPIKQTHTVPVESFKKVNLKPDVGKEVVLRLSDGTRVKTKVVKIVGENVILENLK